MRTLNSIFVLLLIVTVLLPGQSLAQTEKALTSPETFFGFNPGADRKMFNYGQLIDYLKLLEKQSDMVKLVPIGQSEFGRTLYLVFVSAAENIQKLEDLREINRRLALDPGIPEREREKMIEDARAFVLVTLSMHSNETGPTQAAPLMAYNLAAGIVPGLSQHLNNVVFMMVPCHNPDGLDMMVEHYTRYLGTPYEGSSLPGLYHKYAGHNINRDFITLALKENQAVADIYNRYWHPHVLVEKHQMGMNGVRYFVPPNHDPIAENIDETLWNWTWVFGSNMSRDMTATGLSGISQHYLFDNYWPGSTETSLWKNVISLLTEAASVHLATPVFVEPNELQVGGKGLSEYKKSINMPVPWPGGWWRLGNIVEYELQSVYSLIRTASRQKNEILTSRNDLVRKEVERGRNQAPFFYIMPAHQHDTGELFRMLQLLDRHGLSLFLLNEDTTVDGRVFRKGDYVIPLSQPYRPFIKEVMESQRFPVRRVTPGGEMIRPYDITSWSLPLHRGIASVEINTPQPQLQAIISQLKPNDLVPVKRPVEGQFLVFPSNLNESYTAAFRAMEMGIEVFRSNEPVQASGQVFPAGSFLIATSARNRQTLDAILNGLLVVPASIPNRPNGFTKLTLPRIALVETWLHDMDAGWARFLFDTHGVPYSVVRPAEMAGINLPQRFDVIIFPDMGKDQLMQGTSQRGDEQLIPFYPSEFVKGMGKDGWQNVLGFIQNGGKVLSWGRSVDLFIGSMEPKAPQTTFRFPVNNVSQNMTRLGLNIPGSLLRLDLVKDHPLTFGMPASIGVFHRANPVLQTSIPAFDMDRRVIGRFPEGDILMSGFAEKVELLEMAPAMVWLRKGKGQVVLYSFAPNFRGSTPVASKLIFNALLLN